MTKFQIWWELVKRVHEARKEKWNAQSEMTTSEWANSDKSCYKVYLVENRSSDNQQTDYITKTCDDYVEGEICCKDCPMHDKNVAYNEAVIRLQALKRTRNKAFFDMFTRKK